MENQDNLAEQSADANVLVGIDEFTLVLQITHTIDSRIWESYAEDLIDEFVQLSKIEEILGELEQTDNHLLQGYNLGYTLSTRPYYLGICYHTEHKNMGIAIRMSATAYSVYKMTYSEIYHEGMNLAKFLRMVKSDNYTQRLSRVDFTADYFNFPNPVYPNQYLHPDTIYNCLIRKSMKVMDCRGRSNIRVWSGLNKNGVYETVYIGSKKSDTKTFLRIYDKKEEQLSTNGFRYQEALTVDSWVRFEAVFRNNYSHQIGEILMNDTLIQSDNDLECFIAGKILDKYIFKFTASDEITDFSEILIEIASGKEYAPLECASPRDNDLCRSLKYIIQYSGLLSTLAKAYFVFDSPGTTEEILDWISKMFHGYYLDKVFENERHEVLKWVKKHKTEILGQTLEEILESVETAIEKER